MRRVGSSLWLGRVLSSLFDVVASWRRVLEGFPLVCLSVGLWANDILSMLFGAGSSFSGGF